MQSYPSVSPDYQDAVVGQSSPTCLLSSFPLLARSSRCRVGQLSVAHRPVGVEYTKKKKKKKKRCNCNSTCQHPMWGLVFWLGGLGSAPARICQISSTRGRRGSSGSQWSADLTCWAPERFQFDEPVSIHRGLTAKSCRLRLERQHCVDEAHEGSWRWRHGSWRDKLSRGNS
jgi:hypothetical protein